MTKTLTKWLGQDEVLLWLLAYRALIKEWCLRWYQRENW